jgi:hypothetical protein
MILLAGSSAKQQYITDITYTEPSPTSWASFIVNHGINKPNLRVSVYLTKPAQTDYSNQMPAMSKDGSGYHGFDVDLDVTGLHPSAQTYVYMYNMSTINGFGVIGQTTNARIIIEEI